MISIITTQILESFSYERISNSGSSNFKQIQLAEETQRKIANIQQIVENLGVPTTETEIVDSELDAASKYDLSISSQFSYNTKVNEPKKEIKLEELEQMKITTNKHYLKYLDTHKLTQLFQFLGAHLMAAVPGNTIYV